LFLVVVQFIINSPPVQEINGCTSTGPGTIFTRSAPNLLKTSIFKQCSHTASNKYILTLKVSDLSNLANRALPLLAHFLTLN
jgi:hypothetical protein